MYWRSLCFLSVFFTFTLISTTYAQVPTAYGQKMREESNKIYSGNKYNIPPQQYNQIQNPYTSSYNFPYNSYYSNSYYNRYNYYPSYGYGYGYASPYNFGYGYYGSPPPPTYNQAFPDSARADDLYQYIRSR